MSDLDFIWETLSLIAKAKKDGTICTDLNAVGWNRGDVNVGLTFEDGKLVKVSAY